jgi:hypothetical protein
VEIIKLMDNWLKRISRISSWLLLACVVVLVVSGWGITQTGAIFNASGGLIDRRTADMIHRGVVLPMAVFFLLHVFINIWLKFKNCRPWVKYPAAALILALGAVILWLVIYMEYIRLGG